MEADTIEAGDNTAQDNEEDAVLAGAVQTTNSQALSRKVATSEIGRSTFPITRVQKILKADKVCASSFSYI